MGEYAALLDRMMNALLDNDLAVARMLYRDKEEFPPEQQLSVYVHGYRGRLQKVIKRIYPALQHYLGEEKYRAMVDEFIASTPSRYFNIDKYAVAFGRHVAATSGDPFARELAVFESTMRELYHKQETAALGKDWLEQQTPEMLTNTKLQLREAAQLMVFAYPLSDYVASCRRGENPPLPGENPEYLMALRDNGEMHCITLAEAEYALLALVAQGHTLGEALASDDFASFAGNTLAEDFQLWFSRWVNEGFLRAP